MIIKTLTLRTAALVLVVGALTFASISHAAPTNCTTRTIGTKTVTPKMVNGVCTFYDLGVAEQGVLRAFYLKEPGFNAADYNFSEVTPGSSKVIGTPSPTTLSPEQVERECAHLTGASYAACIVGGGVVGTFQQVPGVIESGIRGIGGGFLEFIGLPFMWWVLSMTAFLFFQAAAFLLWFGATLFDNVVFYLVLNMGMFVQNTASGGIRIAWMLVRDLMNIGIIAGFIIVGISTILQTQQYNASRFLARLIIAALLVNFSYFFAGAVIDSANFITQQVYASKVLTDGCSKKLIESVPYSVQTPTTGGLFGLHVFMQPKELCSMSLSFMEIMKLGSWNEVQHLIGDKNSSNFFSFEAFERQTSSDNNKKIFFAASLAGLMLVVSGFVFFSAALLLLGRFVVLILLLVTSPIGVAGGGIPYIDEYAKRWWSTLFAQAFFAPVYVILMGFSLTIMRGMLAVLKTSGGLPGTAGYGPIASGRWQEAINVIPIFVSFFVGIAFMYAALQVARSMSQSGKEFVGGIYDGIQGSLGGIYGNMYQATAGNVLRIPSAAYDATLGQMAQIPIVGQYLSFIGRSIRPDMNAKPFGATESLADSQKGRAEYMKSLPNTVQYVIDYKNTGKAIGFQLENLKMWWQGKDVAGLIERAKNGETLSDAEQRRVERAVQAMKDEELEKLSHGELLKLAPFMTAKQFQRVMGRTDLNDTQRDEIQKVRWKAVDDAKARGDYKEVARLLKNMDKNERKLLMVEYGEYRTDKQMLAALDAKTYDDVIGDSDIYSKDSDYKLADGTDMRDHRAREVANTPSKISETDAKRIESADVKKETLDEMTPAQARRLYKNTKDTALRARLAARFPDLEGPGPAQNDEDEDADKKKKEEDKKKEEEDKK